MCTRHFRGNALGRRVLARLVPVCLASLLAASCGTEAGNPDVDGKDKHGNGKNGAAGDGPNGPERIPTKNTPGSDPGPEETASKSTEERQPASSPDGVSGAASTSCEHSVTTSAVAAGASPTLKVSFSGTLTSTPVVVFAAVDGTQSFRTEVTLRATESLVISIAAEGYESCQITHSVTSLAESKILVVKLKPVMQ